MAGSALSRRLSEIVGVGLFALALIWLVALSSYSPTDPVGLAKILSEFSKEPTIKVKGLVIEGRPLPSEALEGIAPGAGA